MRTLVSRSYLENLILRRNKFTPDSSCKMMIRLWYLARGAADVEVLNAAAERRVACEERRSWGGGSPAFEASVQSKVPPLLSLLWRTSAAHSGVSVTTGRRTGPVFLRWPTAPKVLG